MFALAVLGMLLAWPGAADAQSTGDFN